MSITSRINEMSSHIEQAYDELQGLGADLTNVNKNIENISMVLDDIYDSMPQVSGEGTSLTLEDTRVGKIKSTLKGNTSQSGTPTPTSPIPVNVVSGDNEINVVGKNLLENTMVSETKSGITFTKQDDGSITINGTSTSGVSSTINSNFSLPKGTYTLSLNRSEELSSGDWYVDIRKNNTSIMGSSLNFRLDNKTFTTNEDYENLSVFIWIGNGKTLSNFNIKLQLEIGSSASSYLPYSKDTYNIDLPVENLFDISTNTNGKVLASDGTITDDSKFTISDYIKVSPNTIYTISWVYDSSQGSDTAMRVGYYQNDKTFISRPYNITSPYVITTPNNCYYIRICYHLASHTQVQVEKGTKQNSFTPYGTTPIELCKIGNYQDYFAKSDGRNLFDKDVERKNAYPHASSSDVGNVVVYDNSSATYSYVNCAYVKSGETYTISWKQGATPASVNTRIGVIVDENNVVLQIQNTWQNSTNSITFTSNYNGYLILATDKNATEIMVNEGSSALPYQPYGVGKWYLHKEIGKVVLDGTYTFFKSSTSSIDRFGISFDNIGIGSLANSLSLSSHLVYKASANANPQTFYISTSNSTMYIDFSTYGQTTLSDFTTWLSANTPAFYLILATPTNTEITYQPLIDQLNLLEKAMSKDEQTNISQVNNDLPFIISASALKEWQESTSLNSTLSMGNPLSLGNTLNTQGNNIQPIEVDNIEPLEEEENEES